MGLISPQTHGHLGWRKSTDLAFARRIALQPLATDEIGRAAQWMPVAFRNHEDLWQAVAVLGPVPGANVFVARDGRWRAGYVPSSLRVHPFELGSEGAGLALRAGYVGEARAKTGIEDFFDGPQLTPALRQVERFLKSVETGIHRAHDTLEFASARKLLVPWSVPGIDRVRDEETLGELFQIDGTALSAMSEADVLNLHRRGAWRWIYAHLESLHHAERFRALARDLVFTDLEAPHRPDAIEDAAEILLAIAEDLGEFEP